MAEAVRYTFGFRELAEILIKEQGLHEGLWGIGVKFGINAANVSIGGQDLLPTAMVPILEIGLQKYDQPSSMSVDAAVVNPRPARGKKDKKKAK